MWPPRPPPPRTEEETMLALLMEYWAHALLFASMPAGLLGAYAALVAWVDTF